MGAQEAPGGLMHVWKCGREILNRRLREFKAGDEGTYTNMMVTIFGSPDREFRDDLGVVSGARSFHMGGADVACTTALEERKVSPGRI